MSLNQFREKREYILNQYKKAEFKLPLRYYRQETHFIVPASNMEMIGKAFENGCSRSEQLLNKSDIYLEEIAQITELPMKVVQDVLIQKNHADLILIDGEDATALNDQSIEEGRRNAVDAVLRYKEKKSLLFYRPSGFELEYCFDDIVHVVGKIAEAGSDFGLDGIIFPKPNSVNELKWVDELLSEMELKYSLPQNTVKMQFLAESSRGLELLYEMASIVNERLCGIIFGKADYASELNLNSIENHLTAFEIARWKIVNTSSVFKVPPIDSMTFEYPVSSKYLTTSENKKNILLKLKKVFTDTVSSISSGMQGKWVGHPLQLFMVKLAFEKYYFDMNLESKVEQVEQYKESSQLNNKGATIINGDMVDRATDRQVRTLLRKAGIAGHLGINKLSALEIFSPAEERELLKRY